MNNIKQLIITGLLCFSLGFAVTKTYFPTTITVEKEVVKNDIKTVTKTIERKNGTKLTVTTTTDNSTKENNKSQTAVVMENSKNYHVTLSTVYDFNNKNKQDYFVSVEKRIFSNLFVGVTSNKNASILGFSLAVEF